VTAQSAADGANDRNWHELPVRGAAAIPAPNRGTSDMLVRCRDRQGLTRNGPTRRGASEETEAGVSVRRRGLVAVH
jgi:hypothetical protein